MFPLPWNFPFRKKDGTMTTIDDAISSGGGGGYTLPTASASTKGGVKIGEGLTMDGEVLKNTNPTPPTPYTLPVASAETLGGVKVGTNLSIDENGVLSASGGGGGGSDSGWIEFNGVDTNKFKYRVINNVCYLKWTAGGASGSTRVEVGTVPSGFRPEDDISIACIDYGIRESPSNYNKADWVYIQSSGKIWAYVDSTAGTNRRPNGIITYPLVAPTKATVKATRSKK